MTTADQKKNMLACGLEVSLISIFTQMTTTLYFGSLRAFLFALKYIQIHHPMSSTKRLLNRQGVNGMR